MKTLSGKFWGGLALTAALCSGCGDETLDQFLGRQLNFLLVPNTAATNVDIRLLEQGSGVPGPSVQVGSQNHPTMVALTPNGAQGYISNADSNSITGYNINPDNSNFSQAPGSPTTVAFPPCTLTVHPNGRFMYAVGESNMTGFTIGDNGSLTPLAQSTAPFGGKGVGITPGAFFHNGSVFVHSGGDSGVLTVDVEPDTGALLNDPETNGIDGEVTSLARLPGSEILVVARRGRIGTKSEPGEAFTVQGGVLETHLISPNGSNTLIDSEFFSQDPLGVAVSSRGFAYVGTRSTGSGVLSFQVDGNGNISPETVVAAGSQDSSYPAVDPSGNFVFVSAQSTNQVFGFRVNENGDLVTINGSPFSGYTAPGVPTLAFYQL